MWESGDITLTGSFALLRTTSSTSWRCTRLHSRRDISRTKWNGGPPCPQSPPPFMPFCSLKPASDALLNPQYAPFMPFPMVPCMPHRPALHALPNYRGYAGYKPSDFNISIVQKASQFGANFFVTSHQIIQAFVWLSSVWIRESSNTTNCCEVFCC